MKGMMLALPRPLASYEDQNSQESLEAECVISSCDGNWNTQFLKVLPRYYVHKNETDGQADETKPPVRAIIRGSIT